MPSDGESQSADLAVAGSDDPLSRALGFFMDPAKFADTLEALGFDHHEEIGVYIDVIRSDQAKPRDRLNAVRGLAALRKDIIDFYLKLRTGKAVIERSYDDGEARVTERAEVLRHLPDPARLGSHQSPPAANRDIGL